MSPRFVWTDLSTFKPRKARRFYQRVFGWNIRDAGGGYHIARAGDGLEAAALYEMPRRFVDIGMPSFWMSYVLVSDLDATVETARSLGAKIEIGPDGAPGGGRFALLRDPLGAGFTCLEGDDPGGRADAAHAAEGRMFWNELFVSHLATAADFYRDLFGWNAERSSDPGRARFVDTGGIVRAGVREESAELRDGKEYWGVVFAVSDLDDTLRRVDEAGGETVATLEIEGRDARGFHDPQGAYVIVAGT